MAYIEKSRRRSPEGNVRPAATQRTRSLAEHLKLRIELTRQRALLLSRTNPSLAPDVEPEVSSDEADQASSELEQDLALQAKTRMFARLRHIERALQLMRTSGYGQCRRCQKTIPYERLRVQPDAFYCVPCLTIIEREDAGNEPYARRMSRTARPINPLTGE